MNKLLTTVNQSQPRAGADRPRESTNPITPGTTSDPPPTPLLAGSLPGGQIVGRIVHPQCNIDASHRSRFRVGKLVCQSLGRLRDWPRSAATIVPQRTSSTHNVKKKSARFPHGHWFAQTLGKLRWQTFCRPDCIRTGSTFAFGRFCIWHRQLIRAKPALPRYAARGRVQCRLGRLDQPALAHQRTHIDHRVAGMQAVE